MHIRSSAAGDAGDDPQHLGVQFFGMNSSAICSDTKIASIFGTNTMVTSWICVSACSGSGQAYLVVVLPLGPETLWAHAEPDHVARLGARQRNYAHHGGLSRHCEFWRHQVARLVTGGCPLATFSASTRCRS
jgi:hypothetical protein